MDNNTFNEACKLLRQGKVIACPTESVFGLSCDPSNQMAVNTLLQLKQRSVDKGLIIVASKLQQLQPYIAKLTKQQINKLQQTRTKPITWIVPAHPDTPNWLTGKHTGIAIRITNHPVLSQLCEAIDNALVSTSANRSGESPAKTTLEVEAQFSTEISLIIDSDTVLKNNPSEIRDLISDTILRSA